MDEQLTLSNGVIVGSPTINQNTLLPVYRFFSIVNPIRDRAKLASAFGSYGWSGEAVKIIEANLTALKFNLVQDSLIAKFSPHDEKALAFIEFGKRFGEQLLKCN
jgi:flavorubredoxin